MILSEQTVTYIPPNGKLKKQVLNDPTVFSTWGMIDEDRYLLGDDYGRLYVLSLTIGKAGELHVNLKVNFVGKVVEKHFRALNNSNH